MVLYAKDAMNGLSLANQLQSPEENKKLNTEFLERKKSIVLDTKSLGGSSSVATAVKVRSKVSQTVPVFIPKDTKRHVLRNYSLSHIQPYINLQMLLGHHLGIKGKISRLLDEKDEKTLEIKSLVDNLLQEAKEKDLINPSAMYQFFPAQSDGENVLIYDPKDKQTIVEKFNFPRQNKEPHLCIADYMKSKESGEMDYVGFFSVTAGTGIRELAADFKNQGRFLESHALQALALETAEGFAELIHQQMRDRWGFPDSVDFTMRERFSARYQGQRFSFGYPACPELEDQQKLFKLIQPEDIGIQLTDGCMMEPEASVSAIVFAHPEARYFNVLS
jgi:5-methyltetrahydrofolate--homocysteine methyltransferase